MHIKVTSCVNIWQISYFQDVSLLSTGKCGRQCCASIVTIYEISVGLEDLWLNDWDSQRILHYLQEKAIFMRFSRLSSRNGKFYTNTKTNWSICEALPVSHCIKDSWVWSSSVYYDFFFNLSSSLWISFLAHRSLNLSWNLEGSNDRHACSRYRDTNTRKV